MIYTYICQKPPKLLTIFFLQKPTTKGGNGHGRYGYSRLPKHDQRLATGAATVEGSDQCGLGTKRRVGGEKNAAAAGRNPRLGKGVVWGVEVQGVERKSFCSVKMCFFLK